MPRILCWSIVLLCLAALPASAQVSSPAAAPTAPAATPPQPVETDAILARADTDERLGLSAIERASAADPGLALAPQLEVIARSVDQRLHQFTPVQLRTLPIMRLESLDRHWRFDARRYARWRDALKVASAPYAADVAELTRRRAAWQLTRSQGAALPPVLLARIDAVIDLLARAEQALALPLGRQVELGARANALESRMQAGQVAVRDAISYIDRRLLALDAPPLWQAAAMRDARTDEAAISTGLQIEVDFARAYSEANFANQLAMRTLQLLLLPLLLWLSRRSRPTVTAGEMDASAARILGRPWSTWLLLCMLAMLAFEPDAPVLTRQFAMLIALVPVLRLLPPDRHVLLDRWPYLATALYLLAGLGFIFLAASWSFRLYTLGLTVVALVATSWLLWRAHRLGHLAQASAVAHGLRSVGWIGLTLLVVALVANIVGNVTLGEMLTDAIINSAYLGLLLYVGAIVVITLLHLSLNRPGVLRFKLTREHAPPLVKLLTRLTIAAAIIGWCLYAMDSFRILRPIYELLHHALGHEFTIGDFSLSLGHVLVFVLAIVLASWASRVTRLLLQDVLETRALFARGVGNSIASLVSYAVLVLGVVVALSAAGLKGTQLALIFGALGVGIGFGLQNVVNNFVSGLILIFERPIQPGDAIEVGTTSGRVRDIGMRATRIRTFDGADVVVPNGTLLSERLTNWTLMDRSRRIELKVGVAYGSDPRQVLSLLTTCAQQTPGIASAPAVVALFEGFGASSLDFSVRAWSHDFDNWTAQRSELATRIYAALNQAGIEIPFPQQDVHVRSLPPRREDASPGQPGDSAGPA